MYVHLILLKLFHARTNLLPAFLLLFTFSIFAHEPFKIVNKAASTFSPQFLIKTRDDFTIDSFIETGTYAGTTAELASKIFRDVFTIEIYEPLYINAQKRLKSKRNIHFLLGDSVEYFRNFNYYFPPRSLIWLDAHYSGGGTGGIPGLNLAVEELKALEGADILNAVFLIDDLRGMYHLDPRQNENILGVIQCLKKLDPHFEFYSLGDVGLAFNRNFYPHISLTPMVMNTTLSRLFNRDDHHLMAVLKAEKEIQLAFNSEEANEILRLESSCVNTSCIGGEVTYLFWSALLCLGREEYQKAEEKFRLVVNNHHDHWRVWAYLADCCSKLGKTKDAKRIFAEKINAHWKEEYIPYFPNLEAIL